MTPDPNPICPALRAIVAQSRLAWGLYQLHKSNWITDHPKATPDEIEAKCREIADELGI